MAISVWIDGITEVSSGVQVNINFDNVTAIYENPDDENQLCIFLKRKTGEVMLFADYAAAKQVRRLAGKAGVEIMIADSFYWPEIT